MGVSTFVQPDFTGQSATVYKTSIDDGFAVYLSIGGAFAPHEQSTPDLTVRLDAANFSNLIDRTTVTRAAQNTGSLSAPSVDPRKDIVYVDRITGDVGVIAGAEDASPVDPVIPLGKLSVSRINWTISMTEITNTDLDDIRALGGLGSPLFVQDDGGLILTNTDDGAGAGPLDILDRDSASPTVSDFIGAKIFRGRSSTDAEVDYVELAAQIILATNGSEDARAIIRAMIGGTPTDIITAGPGVQIGSPTDGDKGPGTVNAENGFYEDGVLVSTLFAAKAWVTFTAAGAISDDEGVTSIDDQGVGDWSINLDTAFTSTTYVVLPSIRTTLAGNTANIRVVHENPDRTKTTTACHVHCSNHAATPALADPSANQINVAIFGTQ